LANRSDPVDTTESLNPRTGEWRTEAPMPTARTWLATAGYRGRVFAIGGFDGSDQTGLSNVESFDIDSGTWRIETPMPTPRYQLAAAASGGRIFALGGYTCPSGSCVTEALVESMDVVTGEWRQEARLSTAGALISAAASSTQIFRLGGYIAGMQQQFDTVESLAVDSVKKMSEWVTDEPMPTARSALGVAVVGDMLWAVGGIGGNGGREILDVVEGFGQLGLLVTAPASE
jgi:hypothetical protein